MKFIKKSNSSGSHVSLLGLTPLGYISQYSQETPFVSLLFELGQSVKRA